jgi:hypothetical protein
MSNLTDLNKRVYNCYLKNYRQGEPYRPRKDFSNINPNIATSIIKISNFLTKFPHIKCEEFFEAPSFLYPNDKYPSLNSFTTRAALKNYAMYQKQKEDRNPDKQFEEIKNSLRFIGMYCIEKKIPLHRYLNQKSGYIYAWLDHYREHKINPYCLFELGDVFLILNGVPKDELYLFANNLYETLVSYHSKYENSPKTKEFVRDGVKKVKFFVEKELTNTPNVII